MPGGGGKGGGSTTSSSSNQQNFLPFQRSGIDRFIDILSGGAGEDLLLGGTGRDSLLQVPEQASGALSNALRLVDRLIGGGSRSEQELRSFEDLINDEISDKPFASTIEDIAGIRNAIGGQFDNLEGVDPRAGELLLETARGDFLGSNPFIDRLVGDVTTDVSNAVKDNFIAAGGLEASAAPQAIARESGRVANEIRANVFESERGRQEAAKTNLGTFDINSALQELNKLSQKFGLQLNAQGQINQLTQADVARRLNLIGQRGNAATQLAGLPLAGLNAVGPLAQSFTELPFVPLLNFREALAPFGVTSSSTSETEQDLGLGGFLGAGLAGLGIADQFGLLSGGTALTGGAGTDIFSIDPSPVTDIFF